MRRRILAHRGFWQSAEEKNSRQAFVRAFENGFGIETDIRDSDGDIVISHDMALLPKSQQLSLDDVLSLYNQMDCHSTLALNIKSDGLMKPLAQKLKNHNITNYFLFDMSVPELVQYAKTDLTCFGRASEYENFADTQAICDGVWLDNFTGDFLQFEQLQAFMQSKIPCAVVSDELHGRAHLAFWKRLKDFNIMASEDVMICTDFPHAFIDYLDSEND